MTDLIVDSFAGGGGASTGIEMAVGRGPDYAINHDEAALTMHAANHPDTVHLSENIWQIDPIEVVAKRPVGLAWFSPDCTHFSKAKGGKPLKRHIRDLAWVVVRWAIQVKPRVMMIENVEEFRGWGPLKDNGRPDPERVGETFNKWMRALRREGYKVEKKVLQASNYGSPTIRKRLFIIARRDGEPIVWPAATHGDPKSLVVQAGRLKPWRSAADIIDWSLPCPSIFDTKQEIREKFGLVAKRPLVPNTQARIARGTKRYILDDPDPFIVPFRGPVPLVSSGKAHRVAAWMAQHNTGVTGHPMEAPVSTLTERCTQQQLVTVNGFALNLRGSDRRMGSIEAPVHAITSQGKHLAHVCAFLTKYYGTDQAPELTDPLHSVTSRDRFSLVTINVGGEPWVIYDIGMRMLTARELFRAQGFPDDYVIDPIFNGKPLNKTEQVAKCGNSVCPQIAAALVKANCPFLVENREVACA